MKRSQISHSHIKVQTVKNTSVFVTWGKDQRVGGTHTWCLLLSPLSLSSPSCTWERDTAFLTHSCALLPAKHVAFLLLTLLPHLPTLATEQSGTQQTQEPEEAEFIWVKDFMGMSLLWLKEIEMLTYKVVLLLDLDIKFHYHLLSLQQRCPFTWMDAQAVLAWSLCRGASWTAVAHFHPIFTTPATP